MNNFSWEIVVICLSKSRQSLHVCYEHISWAVFEFGLFDLFLLDLNQPSSHLIPPFSLLHVFDLLAFEMSLLCLEFLLRISKFALYFLGSFLSKAFGLERLRRNAILPFAIILYYSIRGTYTLKSAVFALCRLISLDQFQSIHLCAPLNLPLLHFLRSQWESYRLQPLMCLKLST